MFGIPMKPTQPPSVPPPPEHASQEETFTTYIEEVTWDRDDTYRAVILGKRQVMACAFTKGRKVKVTIKIETV